MTNSFVIAIIVISKLIQQSNGHSITDPVKQAVILNKHNEMRRMAAKGELSEFGWPTATKMYPLTWDDRIANAANRVAERCMYVIILHE